MKATKFIHFILLQIPDELLEADMKRLLYLDNMWIKECVSILPAESIINIVNNVEREISYGE